VSTGRCSRPLLIPIRGIIGGLLVGFLIGAYVALMTVGHVIREDEFQSRLQYELAQERFGATVLLAFMEVFTFIGPFITAAAFGSWIRHAVYGLVAGLGLVVAVTLIAAAITDQQPINKHKGSSSTCIDIARVYAFPAMIVIGPCVGILVGKWLCQPDVCSSAESAHTS
jgi:cytochrome bd-type quinol oxidase subunit 2